MEISLVVVVVVVLLRSVFSSAQAMDPAAAPTTGFNAQTAVTMTVLVSGFFLLGFFSLYIRHCTSVQHHARRDVTGGAAVERGLDASVIETFPTFTYSSVKGLKIGMGELECAVCLNEFEDDETLRLIPKCDHVFHPPCIDAWLTSHSTCPVCRADLEPGAPGEVFLDVPLNVSEPESEPDEPKSKPGSEKMYPDGSDSRGCSPDSTDFVSANQNVPRRTKSPIGFKFIGLFRRSHTTGHSLDNMDRFTLRIPEEVRNQIINSTLNRTKSFGSENQPVWKGFNMTPPFFSKTGSVRSPSLEAAKSLSRSLKSPFHRLFFGVDRGSSSNDGGANNNNNVGERSFDRLKTKDVV